MAGTAPRKGFIDREEDKENGLGDFGVRKYDGETGRFLSGDPLWEKYPAKNTYQYSMNSPIRYIDPSGKDVIIDGPDASSVATDLDNESSGLIISIDAPSGRLTASEVNPGAALTGWESEMLTAINDANTTVTLHTTLDNQITFSDGTLSNLTIGAMDGSVINTDGSIDATQYFNRSHAVVWQTISGETPGEQAVHEVLESYIAATGCSGCAYPDNYNYGHPRSMNLLPLQSMDAAPFFVGKGKSPIRRLPSGTGEYDDVETYEVRIRVAGTGTWTTLYSYDVVTATHSVP